jgi:hypothetical protein
MSPKRKHAADTYTPEIASKICERLANGEGLATICRDPIMPPRRTVRRWAAEDREGFAAMYARARTEQHEGWAEDILDISDDSSLGDAHERRLMVDTRKWLLSKLLPKQYGDKIEVNATISRRDPVELTDAEILAELGVGETSSLPGLGNPPLLEHQPDPTHISAHTSERTRSDC